MERAFGGVLINPAGLILLREPSNHYGGYAWTFAKGRAKPGESPEEAALREVWEETGVVGQTLAKLPGAFRGCLTVTEFFLMQPLQETGQFSWETQSVCWATEPEARQLIALSTNTLGRERDLRVLAMALEVAQQANALYAACLPGQRNEARL
jgi:8-oxo-dGTP pyrophosphatase MutT (NUDIX family)